MNLWIRSQDKKRLIPNPNLYVIWSKEANAAYIGDIIVGHIAKYPTEERALEVLDEIQEFLRIALIVKGGVDKEFKKKIKLPKKSLAIISMGDPSVTYTGSFVYEMPEK